MSAYRSNGCSGNTYDRWVEQHSVDNHNKSAITKMQHQYWVTKETVFRKFGKKEDDCIVSSDAELDAKLELFRSIQESCLDLQRIIEKYQERLCNLAQEENSMGRFLKESGKNDKTRAGKMMTAVGKSLCYSGQKRQTLKTPLLRLYQEVETFRNRAIEDTLQNVNGMEKVRTEYRASLSWMKNVSQELDPDTYKQLERFRKVQNQVRRSKVRFDQLKLDCLQKVDLLAAARCNMFSHALILYQNSLLQFAEKTSKTFTTISNSFKGYQHYDFCVVKELAESSLKLAEQSNNETTADEAAEEELDKDKLLFFESEYHDEDHTHNDTKKIGQIPNKSDSLENLFPASQVPKTQEILLDLDFGTALESDKSKETDPSHEDLLTSSGDDLVFLNELLQADNGKSNFGPQWDAVFGNVQEEPAAPFLLEQLVSLRDEMPHSNSVGSELSVPKDGISSNSPSLTNHNKEKDKKVAWFNLFADLDPLADPDALGSKMGDGHNC